MCFPGVYSWGVGCVRVWVGLCYDMLRLVWQLALFGYLPNFNLKIQKYAVILLLTETASNIAFVVFFFALMGRLSVVFSMKLLLAAGRLKKKRSWFHYMLWTCSDEHLFLEKFTKYFISFREQTPFKLCDHSFLSIREDQCWLQRFQWRCRKWD